MSLISRFYELLDGNIRCVIPYVYEYKTHAKGRWIGKDLFSVLRREFGGGLDDDYWRSAISNGQILVNKEQVPPSYLFKNNDQITHIAHRHEPPVVGSVEFVGQNEDVLAVSKPGSLPVHPCGAYRYNSLTQLLQHEPLIPNQPHLHLVHRLDRVTSGLVLLAKSAEAAGRLSSSIRDRATTKIYLARVKGRFPGRLDHLQELSAANLRRAMDEAELAGDGDGEHGGEGSNSQSKSLRDPDLLFKSSNDEMKSEVSSQIQSLPLSGSRKRQRQEKWVQKKGIDTDVASIQKSPIPAPYFQYSPPSIEVTGASDRVGYRWENGSTSESFPVSTSFATNCVSHDDTDSQNTSINSGTSGKSLILACPLSVASYREAVHAWNPNNGKQSLTRFRVLGYCAADDTSLVECELLTGRTHQIRLHLQLLGSSIANDPCYGGELFYGEPTRRQQALILLKEMRLAGQQPLSKVPTTLLADLGSFCDSTNDEDVRMDSGGSSEKTETPGLGFHCRFCASQSSAKLERVLHCDGIWLHALKYTGPDFTFQSKPPPWAAPFVTGTVGETT